MGKISYIKKITSLFLCSTIISTMSGSPSIYADISDTINDNISEGGAFVTTFDKNTLADELNQLGTNFDVSLFTIADKPQSMNVLNYEYCSLALEMGESVANTDNYEKLVSDRSGYSADIKSVYDNAYGNIDMSLKETNIPEDFDASSVSDELNSKRDATFDTVKSSDVYKTVNTKLSTGTIFAAAKEGVKSKTLMSSSELKSSISAIVSKNKSISIKASQSSDYYRDVYLNTMRSEDKNTATYTFNTAFTNLKAKTTKGGSSSSYLEDDRVQSTISDINKLIKNTDTSEASARVSEEFLSAIGKLASK